MPGPGFAAGPCLFKDTMQLAAFSNNKLVMGHSAMLVNEGLPAFLVNQLKQQVSLSRQTVGILGMAFKAEIDDPRASLSYKLKKLLELEAARVLCSDPYVKDKSLVPVEQILDEADVIFIATPHQAYRNLKIPAETKVVDIWDCLPAAAATILPVMAAA
jgi:UDP-N-acetyl-D-mannosaminuronic acid dehydrogenase